MKLPLHNLVLTPMLLLVSLFSLSQVNLTSSNLPIIKINTNGNLIEDNIRISADLEIIYNGIGARNYTSDPSNDYNGKISIELRGSSSQNYPKKSYSFETQDSIGENNNVSLIDLPVENDWTLIAPYSDKTLMRNVLTYHLANKMGNYAPRTKFCEVLLNGDYQGVYVLTEKIKRDNDRVDIYEMDDDDILGDSLTGGYIVKIDKTTGGSNIGWTSSYSPPNRPIEEINFLFHYPKEDDIEHEQEDYIENYISEFEDVLSDTIFTDSINGYAKYIDVLSFIDFYIINELTRNVDGYRSSTFLHKDRLGKLNAGPVWDFNISLGNADYCDGELTTGWAKDFNYTCPTCGKCVPFWWERLLEDSYYENSLKCRWETLRLNELSNQFINSYINSLSNYLDESQQRNFQKWNVLGVHVGPNYFIGNTYQEEINYLKNWLNDRVDWLDANIPGDCNGLNIYHNENGIFKLYPNPVSDVLKITFNNNNVQKNIRIYSLNGKRLFSTYSSDSVLNLDLNNLDKGVYIIEVIEKGIKSSKKIVKV